MFSYPSGNMKKSIYLLKHTNLQAILRKEVIICVLTFALFSCESEKKYSDYNEEDFYEVQGIIDNVGQNNNPFDSPTIKNISFTYFIDRPIPKKGIEKNIDLFEIEGRFYLNEVQNGYPLIVLVHKANENISFYGQVGILGNLNPKEKEVLTKTLSRRNGKTQERDA